MAVLAKPARGVVAVVCAVAASVLLPVGHAVAANAAPAIVPAPREWTGGTGAWTATSASRLVVPAAHQTALSTVASRLRADFAAENGLALPLAVGATPTTGDVVLSLGSTDTTLGDQGYALTAGSTLTITARTAAGAFNGTRTLLQGLRGTGNRTTFPAGSVRDWPRYPDRGQMIDVGRRYFPVDWLKAQIRQMSWYKLNTLHLHLTDWNGFRIESTTYPGLASPERYSRAEITDLVAYAKGYGVTIVPELDFPAHSSHFSAYDPSLAFTCASLSKPTGVPWEGADAGGWTLDVTKPATRQFAINLVNEVADLFDSPYVHIGGDELPNDTAKAACPELVTYQRARGFAYPGDVFVDFLNVLNDAVRAKGKTTQLWEWWDYGGARTSIAPPTNVIVNDWLADGSAHANAGYPVVVTTDGVFYVSVGFGQQPGDYGYSNPYDVFNHPYSSTAGIRGYKISRWMDRSYALGVDNVDHFARRPLQVMADRTWGGPKAASLRALIDVLDRVGPGEPGADTARSQTGWAVTATSQETQSENGSAANAADNDPYTMWHTRYTGGAPALPAELVADTGTTGAVSGVRYLPRQDGGTNGKVKDYEVWLASAATGPWTRAAAGRFPNSPVEQTVPVAGTARFVKLRVLSEWGAANTHAAVAELDVLTPRFAAARVPQQQMSVRYADSAETAAENGAAANVLDGDPATIWHTAWSTSSPPPPHEIQLDLGQTRTTSCLYYLPRQNSNTNGTIARYEVHTSTDGTTWTAASSGTWENTKAEKSACFSPTPARYVRLRALSEVNGNPWTSAAELNVLATQ
ncbi:family 20 glycosylhydrolase [Actinokineospora soli]|uniref:beta-N-acetylhexosaminidase n=1 Tax=Actinokineospora soli TaxID=1048753 RepID=A0ABW2TRE1_9PSEU